MSDIIINPTAVLTPVSVGGQVPQRLQSVLATIPPGTEISGFVINRDASGNPILRTQTNGDVTIESQLFLKIGSEVLAKIVGNSTQTQARIITVDGLPPDASQLSQRALPQETVVVTNTNAPAPSLASGIAASSANAPPSALPLATSEVLLQTSTPVAPVVNAAPNTSPNIQAIILTVATPTLSAETLQVAENYTPGQSLAVRVVNIQPPSTSPTSASPTPNTLTPNTTSPTTTTTTPTTISATVLGTEADGTVIVQSEIGTLKLPASRIPTTVGTTLLLNIEPQTKSPTPVSFSAAQSATTSTLNTLAPTSFPTRLLQQWPALQQTVQLLAQSLASQTGDPADPEAILAQLLPWANVGANTVANAPANTAPQPQGHTFSAGLQFFLTALFGGDVQNWLGHDNIKRLEAKPEGAKLLAQLESDFSSLRNVAQNPNSPWQTLIFPVAIGHELQMARLFVRRDKEKESAKPKARKAEDTRFIVEVELSQLGAMQLDGWVRIKPPETEAQTQRNLQFDLIVRSHESLPNDIEADIRHLYQQASEITGFNGSVQFQHMRDFPLHPLEEVDALHTPEILA